MSASLIGHRRAVAEARSSLQRAAADYTNCPANSLSSRPQYLAVGYLATGCDAQPGVACMVFNSFRGNTVRRVREFHYYE